MRSTTLISLGSFLATMLALTPPAFAQKGDTKKSDSSEKKSDAGKKSDSSEKKSDWSDTDDDAKTETKTAGASANPSSVEPPKEVWDNSDVSEVPGKSYFFVGLRYRGNVVPGFMINMFVDEGKTVWTNMVGAEFDLRKDGFSLIPALSYHELGTGDILFKQKNTKDIVGNYSVVNSGMKLVYASVDLLWSTKISKNVEFEYGAGFGLGAVFGDLENSWVREDPNGKLVSETGKRMTRCEAVGDKGTGCNAADHQNSDVNKVNGYKEKTWFDGGSKPVVFPWISIPQIGLRIKPIKQFVARLGVGFALTGFWFGLSGQYGLERKPD